MPKFDLAALPHPLQAYFKRSDRRTLTDLFATDAVVKDEGETMDQPEAIAHWLERVETRYRPRYEVLSAQTVGNHTMVSFIVSGSFPGSPATLRQAFVIDTGKIARLETL